MENKACETVCGKTCLVTGGGGSIGSELTRQLAALGAEKIIIADIYENGAYDLKCAIGSAVQIGRAHVCQSHPLISYAVI